MTSRPSDRDARVKDVCASFEHYFAKTASNPRWRPTADTPHGRAMDARWATRSPSRLLARDGYFADAFASLRAWGALRMPIRGGVARAQVDRSFERVQAGVDGLAKTALGQLTGRRADGLYRLFESIQEIKPTRTKWVATSKALYLLLPNLVVPMDSSTAWFLGWGRMRAGLRREDFDDAYQVFRGIARCVAERDATLLARLAASDSGAVPLGQARVVDFAIVGFVASSR